MLSTQEVSLVQTDWSAVAPIADTAATLFYDRLFELDPALRPLFKADLTDQKKKLLGTLAFAVKGLDDLGTLVPVVQELGKRHAGYGVKSKDYETVGAALLWTLKKGLGDGFTQEHEAAWTKVYRVLATTMKDASASPD